uniref:Uncharacterized protein n=1 Tax=Nelumbo nucifera TaxID=4432 RepID=A0A822YTM5_NELNU|nr:TPA_asm: hypothetical protein HUJ06_005541 [Nelumbo nucifera]
MNFSEICIAVKTLWKHYYFSYRGKVSILDLLISFCFLLQGNSNSKETVETMDYTDPGPNTNPRSGYLLSPPPPVPQG